MGYKQKRKTLINNTILFYLTVLSVFATLILIVIYGFLFVYTPSNMSMMDADFLENELKMIKQLVLVYVFILSILCFYMGYLYSHTKFLGIFRRITKDCHDIRTNKKDVRLYFRQSDKFKFFADEFNKMVQSLKDDAPEENKENKE